MTTQSFANMANKPSVKVVILESKNVISTDYTGAIRLSQDYLKPLEPSKSNSIFAVSQFHNTIRTGELLFNLLDLTILKRSEDQQTFPENKISAQTFYISNWQNQYIPLLNDTPIKIKGKSLALSVSEDESEFFLISDKERILFTMTGNPIWNKPETHSATNAVITKNKKYIIVKYINDVIKWYDFKNGENIFSLYIDTESLQWIIWTPDGYFDHSETSFNPLSLTDKYQNSINLVQLRNHLFRPDIIQKIILGQTPDNTKFSTRDISIPHLTILTKPSDLSNHSIHYCIQNKFKHPIDVVYSSDNITVQKKSFSIEEFNSKAQCQYAGNFINTKSKANIELRAIDLTTNLWSQSISLKNAYPKQIDTPSEAKVFLNNSNLKQPDKNIKQFLKFIKKENSEIIKRLPNMTTDKLAPGTPIDNNSYIHYISASCEIKNNDIFFKDIASNKSFLKLSELKHFFQTLEITNNLLLLDCLTAEEQLNKYTIKKIIKDFEYETGRSFLANFYNKQQLKNSKLSMSFMMTGISQALSGEADNDDNSIITSNEFLSYLNSSLPSILFEHTGENGIIFSHSNPGNTFILPIKTELELPRTSKNH